jgi:hypothetical protein
MTDQKLKKQVYKKWWFWVLAVFAFFIIVGSLGSKGDKALTASGSTSDPKTTSTSTPAATVAVSEKPTAAATSTPSATPKPTPAPATPTPAPKNKETISKAEFDTIKNGMSYEEVTQIIGGPGELLSESGNKGEALHTVMYMYTGEGGLGANANMMFQGNKLMNKAQLGLK